ncbi:beta-propeller domain-containing protein [Candidatus Saccharibacteria bacterium]|nr:beta-propeller domain-containing protein [Candidatus Saccharibacteria bacterium]
MKKSLSIKITALVAAVIIVGIGIFIFARPKSELRNINSEAELYSFYNRNSISSFADNPLFKLLLLPFSAELNVYRGGYYYYDDIIPTNGSSTIPKTIDNATSTEGVPANAKDYSTTNIQVENVDEADIIKTDGDYMYSISNTDVIISDVRDVTNPKISSRIESTDESIPEDLILSGDTLTIIGTEYIGSNGPLFDRNTYSYYRYYNKNNTTVRVYDISNHEQPSLKKNFKLYEPYYTSRRIDNQLYVISSGRLREKSGDEKLVEHSYFEDLTEKEYPVKTIRYLKDVLSDNLTLISVLDLSNPEKDITVEPFLLDISNAYISENAFYLLEEGYKDRYNKSFWDMIKPLFGFKGVIGFFDSQINDFSYNYNYQTEIYKFNIEESGDISYAAKTSTSGNTINQYSFDENAGHLRIALEDKDGSYIAIFDEKLNKIGESGRVGKNERMYASRFLGNKAYLVTYKNTDPLFVIDLSNEKEPKVLGELKIPGYSVYLHPYDENHLIGIGVDTTEETRKDENGRVISSFAYITGMKLALFDISDFTNPKEISKLHIGDSYTSSAILTNPKALLFSKEKQLLGIPVNDYESEFKIEINGNESITDLTDYFYDDINYVDEGYLIYNINLENGIEERGEIIHEKSNLIRGAYINDDLITVSENLLRVNDLNSLEKKAELNFVKE